MIRARVTSSPLDPAEVLARVGDGRDGAEILFVGRVRNHAEGRAVSGLRYEAYEEMACEVLTAIAHEAAERLGTDRLAVVHRVGSLDVGEASVVIAASSPHRAEAFDAARYVIEEIKKRLPMWKKERYLDGEEGWVEGTRPPAGGVGAGPP